MQPGRLAVGAPAAAGGSGARGGVRARAVDAFAASAWLEPNTGKAQARSHRPRSQTGKGDHRLLADLDRRRQLGVLERTEALQTLGRWRMRAQHGGRRNEPDGDREHQVLPLRALIEIDLVQGTWY